MADNFENELNRSEQLLKERLVRAGKVAKDITDKAFRELLDTFDDYSKSLDDINKKLNEQLSSYDKIKGSAADFGSALKGTLPFLKDNKDLAQKLTSIYSSQNKLAEQLVYNQEDLTRGNLSTQDVAKDIAKIRQQQLNIELTQRNIANEMLVTENSMVGLQGEELEEHLFKLEALREINEQLEEQKKSSKTIEESLRNQSKSASEIETKAGIGGKLLKGLQKIPVLGDLLDLRGAEEAMKSAATQGASSFGTLAAGAKALGPSLSAALGPLGLILIGIQAIVSVFNFFKDAMFEADKRIISLSRNLQLTNEESQQLDEYFKAIKGSLETQYNLTKEIYQAQAELSTLTSTSVLYSKESLDAQIQLTKEYKLQATDAANLNRFFLTGNKTATENLHIASKTTSEFFKRTGILFRERDILEKASKVSGQMLVSFKGSTEALMNAVMTAEKLGISLDKTKDISNSLLNFEDSISSELEAELLVGKDINLERARGLALQGKFAEAAEEAVKQVGTLEDFQRLNVIQQTALAKAAGLTADELSDALLQQKVIGTQQEAQYQRFKEADMDAYARKLAMGELSDKEIEDANKRLDAQEKFNIAIEQGKEMFSDLVSNGALQTLADAIQGLANSSFIKSYAEEGEAKRISGELEAKSKEKPGTVSQEELDIAKRATDQQTTGETVATIAGYTAAGAAIGSIIPGVGTLIGAGVGLIAGTIDDAFSDYEGKMSLEQSKKTAEEQKIKGYTKEEIAAKDFVIKTLEEDTVVAAGGTNLGRTDEMVTLLKELTTAMKNGGNVYLDLQKVGSTTDQGTYRLNS